MTFGKPLSHLMMEAGCQGNQPCDERGTANPSLQSPGEGEVKEFGKLNYLLGAGLVACLDLGSGTQGLIKTCFLLKESSL